MIFETLNLYGINRYNRQNLAGYGNEDRSGQYLFPPHVEKKQYGLWDPDYADPRVVTFDHVDKFRGIRVYVFNSLADGIDETAGFESLPDVPEKYHALSYGKGRFWIEPSSGVVVDYEDAGRSYFIETKTGERFGEPMARWSARYTAETIKAQLQLATTMRGHAPARSGVANEKGRDPPLLVVGTRSCAIRGGTSSEASPTSRGSQARNGRNSPYRPRVRRAESENRPLRHATPDRAGARP